MKPSISVLLTVYKVWYTLLFLDIIVVRRYDHMGDWTEVLNGGRSCPDHLDMGSY